MKQKLQCVGMPVSGGYAKQRTEATWAWGGFLLCLGGLLGLACWGCGPQAKNSGGQNENNNENGTPVDGGVQPDSGSQHTDAFVGYDVRTEWDAEVCGAQTEEIELINQGDPPDLLIVLDRSGSMMMPPGMNLTGPTKWQIMTDALEQLLDLRESNIRFGLTVFPTDEDCAVDPGARVEIALDNAQPINGYLDSTGPGGNTPAHFALQEALAYYATIPVNPEGRYVLFATDGIPNCGGDPPNVDIETNAETVAAVEDLAAADIHTFVLGFGGLFGLDPETLNDAAQAGLEPRPNGPPYFYHADDASELQSALDAIAGGIIFPSCSFDLASQPPVPDDVAVYFDGNAVPRTSSHTDGWDYHPDSSTITFFGSYCDMLQSGQVEEVDFIFGCPGPQID
jgi:hypothetical protein